MSVRDENGSENNNDFNPPFNHGSVPERSENGDGANDQISDQEIQGLLDLHRKKSQDNRGQKSTAGEDLQLPAIDDHAGNVSEEEELAAYQLLFDILDEEPAVRVPVDFSSRLSMAISTRKNRVNDIRFYLLISVISLFGLSLAWLMLSMIDKSSAAVMLDLIVAHKWIWLLSLATIFVVQYIEQQSVVGSQEKNQHG